MNHKCVFGVQSGNDFKKNILTEYGSKKVKNNKLVTDLYRSNRTLDDGYDYGGEVGNKNKTKLDQYADFLKGKKDISYSYDKDKLKIMSNQDITGYKIDTYQTSSTLAKYRYATEIGPYKLNLNEKIENGVRKDPCKYTATLTVERPNGTEEEIGCNIIRTSGKLYYICSNKVTIGTNASLKKITIKETYEKIKARIILFAGESRQSRAVVRGVKQKATNEMELKFASNNKQIDVSLQQYIYSVSSPSDIRHDNIVLNRKDWKAEVVTNEKIEKRNGDVYSKKDTDGEYINKRDRFVNIFLGETVTYRVHVYNNSSSLAKKIQIKNGVNINSEFKGFYNENGNNLISNPNSYYTKDNYKYYMFTIKELSGKGEYIFTFKIKYGNSSIGTNLIKASTYNNLISNTTDCRTSDGDYIKIKQQDFSMQMCITKQEVDGKSETYTNYDTNDRRWRLANSDSTEKIFSKNYSYSWDKKIDNEEFQKVNGYSMGELVKENSKVRLLTNSSGKTETTKVTFTSYIYNNCGMYMYNRTGYIGVDQRLTVVSSENIDLSKTITKDGFKYYKMNLAKINLQDQNNSGPNYYSNMASITVTGFSAGTKNYARSYIESPGTECRTEDYDYIKISEKDVSLQMYITQRMDMNGTEKQQLADSRQNQKAKSNSNINIASGVVSTSTVKEENKVGIEQNEKVKFKIRVYNNSAVTVKNQVVKLDTKGLTLHNDNGIWQNNETTISEIAGYGYVDLYAVISGFTKESSDNIRAYLPDTDTEYRTDDMDYVSLGEIEETNNDASIQKYIVKVNNSNIDSRENWCTTSNTNTDISSRQTSIKSKLKDNNPVKIKVGDIVYYRIIIYNNTWALGRR